ncbi:hypothetical protein BC835DRAFT_1228821, partial [Cytidiella melzeri]
YLQEMFRRKGRGSQQHCVCCARCGKGGAVFRCQDCFGDGLFCKNCCVDTHASSPLHRMQEWTGHFFRKISLRELGLVAHLGEHTAEATCIMPRRKTLVVLHVNGIHRVVVDFCGCRNDVDAYRQLLRASWYPATPLQPETCATFELLELFHTMNLQGNLTVYDLFKSLEMLTDGWNLLDLPDRQLAFTNMVREWRNLLMLMRAGRGYKSEEIEKTQPGELAVQCRACPHPGINLPENFEDVPDHLRYLYWQTIAVDCNFRLKNRHRSSSAIDVCLSPGWAYFVEHQGYLSHVKRFATQEEMSTCAGFQAMLLANLKKAKGLNATGVVGVACSRHEHWRPNGMGDLQRGERYCNVDYVLLAALVGVSLHMLITYDIACQYFKLFWSRMLNFPPAMQLGIPDAGHITAKVPKGHIRAHEDSCQGPFSLNYTDGAADTDGEGIERLWSWLNKAAPSGKEMTQASRHELLDDFCGYSNWKKTLGLSNLLARRMLDAIKEAKTHREESRAFDARLREQVPDAVEHWEQMMDEWKADSRRPCPYVSAQDRITLNDVRLAVLREDERDMRARGLILDATPGAFLCLGIEIETMQMALQADIANIPFGNVLTELSRDERRRAIRRKIMDFRRKQQTQMPGLYVHVRFSPDGSVDDNVAQQPEDIPLYMPSAAAIRAFRANTCEARLLQIEEQLRSSQADEALNDLRRHLRTRTFANRYKIKNFVGQAANTRGRQWLAAIDKRALAAAKRYRHARAALLELRGPGDWEKTLRVLKDDDVRSLNERVLTEQEKIDRANLRREAGMPIEGILGRAYESGAPIGEGRRTFSWIWLTPGGREDFDNPGVEEDLACPLGLRIEWAKSNARATRWWEAVNLLHEEMRRAVAFCHSRSQWWMDRAANLEDDMPADVREGLCAYAFMKADAETQMGIRWANQWEPLQHRALEFM